MAEQNYLDQLNEAQRAAVEYTDGPELVVAGAGSGKTRVITYKIAYLLDHGHRPGGIMALTFTNKAAREMRQRIGSLVGEEIAARLWMGTFHSIFSRIIRRHADRLGFKSDFTIYDAADSKSLVKNIIRELKLDDKIYRPGQVLADISHAKNMLFSPEDYAADKEIQAQDARANRPDTAEIYRIYRDRCRIAGAMDFDDLLYYTDVLLRDNDDIRQLYRDRFSYILVDEYQDTNYAQHVIIRQLCEGTDKLCVVGDDAQSIYAFRGANIRNILDMSKAFPSLRTFKLEENYRSTRNIIGAANSLIAANTEQIRKEVYSNKEDGELIEVLGAYNEYEEAGAVVSRINSVRRRHGLAFNDVAVLYRNNVQSRVIESALRERNIPYRVYGGLAFYQRKEVKDAISYFRLSVNPNDDEALTRIVNTPKRGIGDTTVGKLRKAALDNGVSIYAVLSEPQTYGLDVNRGTMGKLKAFAGMIADFNEKAASGMEASSLANMIVEQTGLMREYLSENTPEFVSKRENLQELLKGVAEYNQRTVSDGVDGSMGDFLSEISLLTDQDTPAGDDAVTLMTIHAAKGLEFGAIFIIGAEENLLPSDKCRGPKDVEEERRLMYVAITRAKRYCMISFASNRTMAGRTDSTNPSRFIYDIDARFLRLNTGTKLPGRRTAAPRPRPVFTPRPVDISEVKIRQAIGIQPQNEASAPVAAPALPYRLHDISELSAGMNIEHSSLGRGTIAQVVNEAERGHRIIVQFATGGAPRTLLLKFARFTIIK